MNNQTELFTGRARRDAGIKKAECNAGKEWNARADELFDCFIRMWSNLWKDIDAHGAIENPRFMSETFRSWAYEQGLPNPPSLRAFGSVMLRAARAGKIVKVGYGQVKNPKAHQANSAVWRKI